MKFEKILILVYLLVQALLMQCINQISEVNILYISLAFLTVAFFLISYLKDPGYLVVEQINMEIEHRENVEVEKNQPQDNECLASGKQINKMSAAGVINNQQIKNDNLMQYNQNLQHLGFSKRKNAKRRDSRYCGICMINQPYRTRHCHQCEKCVATYDHHCPWINNCVGQKNRHFYYLFLVSQTLQVFLAAILVCSAAVNKILPIKSEWILGISLIIFLSVIVGLTVFHTYLMIFNVTTCNYRNMIGELSRWDSIPYLSKYQRSKQSPFSKGIIRNVKQYWACGFSKKRKIWQFEN